MKLSLLLLALFFPLQTLALAPAAKPEIAATTPPAQAPVLTAKSWLLYDYNSQQVLLEQNSNQRIEPASLTKLMTAYVTFSKIRDKQLAPGDKVTPTLQALRSQRADARMYLSSSKPVTIQDLLTGLIVISANDAARVLAETISGNEVLFAELMNKEALRLGMLNTHFVNASGLPDALHYSSAHDLALLAAAIIRDFPEFYEIYAKREFEYNQIKHYNRNRLLWLDPNVDGMKTGHTESAGYCLIASSNRDNHRLISVVIGSSSENQRVAESQRLLNQGYQDFEFFNFYQPMQSISNVRIWKGTENQLKIGLRDGLTLTLPKGQRPLLKATTETEQPLLAPVSEGKQIGILKLTLNGQPYMEYPLIALENIQLVNIFSRGIDSIRMMFSK